VTLALDVITSTVAGASAAALISVAADMPGGACVVPFAAVASGITQTAAVTVNVSAPYFELSASPKVLALTPGGVQTVTVAALGHHGAAAPIFLALEDMPLGLNYRFDPNPILPAASASLILTDTGILQYGDYTLGLVGVAGHQTVHVPLRLNVLKPGFALAAEPTRVIVQAGQGVTLPVGLAGLSWALPVTVTVSGQITDGLAGLSPTPSGPPLPELVANVGAGFYLQIQTGPMTPEDTYALQLRGESGGQVRTLPVEVQIVPTATTTDLYVRQEVSADPAVAGELLTYTVSAANRGPLDATDVVLTQTLPANAEFLTLTPPPAPAGCSPIGPTGWRCDLPRLARGGRVILMATVRVPADLAAGAELVSEAGVSAAQPDGNPADNFSRLVVPVAAQADLELVGFDLPGQVKPGGELIYVLFATNRGPSLATGVRLTDTLPVNTQLLLADTTRGTCTAGTGQVACDLESLGMAETATVVIRARASGPGPVLVNRGEVYGDQPDPNPANNVVVTRTTVLTPFYLPLYLKMYAAPVVTPTPTPSCANVIGNGGFEEDAAWTFEITASTAGYTTAEAHTGLRSARLGLLPGAQAAAQEPGRVERNLLGEDLPAGATFSSAYQTISIPTDARSVSLRFWWKPGTTDTANDFQRVLLLEPGTYRLVSVVMVTLENSPTWQELVFDLSVYRGRSVVLYFETYNDSAEAATRTWMFLDDVRVEVCR
jgi:uncharacterized repeat protein (TIGR01451 family)